MRSETKNYKYIAFDFTIPEVTFGAEVEVEENATTEEILDAMNEASSNVASNGYWDPQFFNVTIEGEPVNELLQPIVEDKQI